MRIQILSFVFASFLIGIPATSFASGGYSYEPVEVVDQDYETGKAIYKGRQAGVEKLKYCVNVGGELLPVKRSALKSFKGSSFSGLTSNLFDCTQPGTPVSEKLGDRNTFFVVYYLNKRYKLKLSS